MIKMRNLFIGRKSFSKDKLIDNYKHLIDFLKKEKPETLKSELIKSILLLLWVFQNEQLDLI